MAKKPVAIISRGRGPLLGAIEQSIQDRAKPLSDSESYVIPLVLNWAAYDDELPAWWTPSRDQRLREVYKEDGMLSSSIYNMQAILSTIGWNVDGPTPDVKISRQPFESAEYGQGLKVTVKKLAEDWFTQDNGIFLELIGPGAKSSPLLEAPRGIAHIDAGRCWRSGDPEHPVWYMDKTSKWHKIHWTRVSFTSSNPSANEDARGIGYCAVSRICKISRMIRDTVAYKGEKIGGRQTRAIMTVSGAPKKAVELALKEAETAADNANLYKLTAVPIIAAPGMGNQIEAKLLELAGVPDGFNWEEEVQMYMYIVALALGVDARELWPSTQSGATKADAEVQHRKAMRKGVGDFATTFEYMANTRVCVGDAIFRFKPKDYEEQKAQADVEKVVIDGVSVMQQQGFVTPRGGLLYLVNKGVLPIEYLDNPELSLADRTPDEPSSTDENRGQVTSESSADQVPTTSDERSSVGTAM